MKPTIVFLKNCVLRVPLCVIHLIHWRIEFRSLNFYMYLSKEVLTRTSYGITMFEDESRDSMKAVTVSDFYLFDALLFDLCKAVKTIR